MAAVRGGLAQAWRRAASEGLAFAVLLALVLAPLNLCCLDHFAAASDAGILEAALGPGAHIVVCAHGDAAGGDRQGQTPASSNRDHCPACHIVNGAALVPPLATAGEAYALNPVEILAAPETPGFRAAAAPLAARPRGPPVLI